jgi:hypothetical protein
VSTRILFPLRLDELEAVLTEAQDTLEGLEVVFEERDFGDDDVYDPDELDEREAGLCEDSAKLLAKLVHLLTSEDLATRTTASAVAHFSETGNFIPREV